MSLIYGSSGNDVIEGSTGDESIFGFEGNDTIQGGKGKDTIYGMSGNDYLDGGDDNDNLSGGADGDDTLDGGAGDDDIWGDIGSDILNGGTGNDTLYGEAGSDVLNGGAGIDKLYGGEGNDTFYINDLFDYINDTGGSDTAYVSINFAKIPSSIEKVTYSEGALALPYWIDALVDDYGSGSDFQQLLGASKTWYYAFPSALPSYDTNSTNAIEWSPFTSTQIARTKIALNLLEPYFDFKFVESIDPSALNTLSFANNKQTDSAAYAKLPSKYLFGSDVFLNNDGTNTTLADGSYSALTLIHEIGHALGLKHPFAGTDNVAPYLPTAEDKTLWTVVSYTHSPAEYTLDIRPLDVAALQYIYGPSKTSRVGNDTYKISQSNSNFIWDGAGVDTLDASDLSLGATVYLNPGYWGHIGAIQSSTITSSGQITVNFGSVIENLTGSSYEDKLFGNDIENVISGGAGSDVIDGLAGNDTINGGSGDDQIDGGAGLDIAQFSGKRANYLISNTAGSYQVTDTVGSDGTDRLLNIEQLVFTDLSVEVDIIAPTVSTLSPADEATGVGVTSNIILTFSEAVVARSGGTIELMTDYGSGHQSVEVFSVSDATRVTISGNVVTIDPTSALLPSTGYHLGFNNALADTAGNAFSYTHGQYNFTTTAAVIGKAVFGTTGNDILRGDAGNDTLSGGAGTDTAIFSGNRAGYTISKTSTGWTVSSTAEGVDTLADVERLKFADTAIALDTSGVGGQTYRVYKAAFNRTPDVGGLGFWISGMDSGVSLNAVAQGFVNSDEFKAVYGASPTTAEIVTRFYDNVLGRAADSGGYNYWLGILDSGQASVAGVLASFSESPENQAAVIGVIGNGILYTPYG
jgi:Ca2+-binding RTX toxin-like protein